MQAPDTEIGKISDLNGKRIAVLNGSIQQTVFQQLMDGFGYKVTLVLAASYDEAFSLAENGSVDAAISNQLFGDYFYQRYGLKKTTVDFDPVDLFYATAQGQNHDLLDAIDRDLGLWIPESDSAYYTLSWSLDSKRSVSCTPIRLVADRRHYQFVGCRSRDGLFASPASSSAHKRIGANECRTSRE